MNVKITDFVFFRIKQLLIFLLCLFLLTEVFSISADAQNDVSSKTVRVGWFDSSYNLKDADGRRSGYSYDYQRKIAAYTGWKYEYVEGSWSDLMEMLKNGEIDMLSDVSYTAERAKSILYPSYSMGTEEYYIYF